MIITKETDYALRILRVLLDGEKHSVAEMSEDRKSTRLNSSHSQESRMPSSA